jgi:hypothetical protein
MKKNEEFLDAANAEVIADLVADPDTPDFLRVQMINKMLESRKAENFFAAMLSESLSYGACPECGHENHWLIPENDLNQMGWVSCEEDPRVKRMTTVKDCERWQEACAKKRITI